MKTIFVLEGMHCQSCVSKIENALKTVSDDIVVTLNPPQVILNTEAIPSLEKINHLLAQAGSYRAKLLTDPENLISANPKSGWITYAPLLIIVLMITLVAARSWPNRDACMLNFMAGFFIVFGSFKLFDLPGFKNAFATYDLLAQIYPPYGWIYPFLELALGFAFLYNFQITAALIGSILLMGFGGLGVIQALRKKSVIRCACLGTSLNLPMSTITLWEDLVMVIMSVIMLMK